MALLRDQMKQELSRKQAQQQQGGPPGYRQMEAGRPPQAGENQEFSNANPEEQAIYDKVVLSGLRVLYDDATHKDVMKTLASADPATSVAELVAVIIKEVDQINGGRIPETVILPAAMEIMDAATELAKVAKIFELDANQAETAVQVLVARLVDAYGLDPEEAQQMLMENVPANELMAAGQESAINPMRWQPYRDEGGGPGPEEPPAQEQAEPNQEEETR